MIRTLRGLAAHVGLDHVVVEVGGLGVQVFTTPAVAAATGTGSQVLLFTTMVVREESLTLYGFGEQDERELFERLQTVSGVGPRLALAMLAVHPPNDLRRAITTGDLVALTRVPGIGRKGAERIALELRDKVALAESDTAVPGTPASGPEPWRARVQEALVGLGWSAKQAADAVETVATQGRADTGPGKGTATELGAERGEPDVAAMLRAALRRLGRG